MINTLIKQYKSKKQRMIVLLFLFLFILFFISFTQNFSSILGTAKLDISLSKKIDIISKILLNLYSNNLRGFELFLQIGVAFFVALQLQLLFILTNVQKDLFKVGGGAMSTVLVILGSHCLSCGSAILTAIFGTFFSTTLITFLPLGGKEFLYIALFVSIFSIVTTLKKLKNPFICE